MTKRVFNFSPGPAVFPLRVLEQIQQDLLCLPGAGASIMEISHRSGSFKEILSQAQQVLRELLNIPDNYEVLFLQGGSRLQFSMVPMNLAGHDQIPSYLVTGTWGKKAAEEAARAGKAHIVWDGGETGYDRVPVNDAIDVPDDAAFLHYTSNETIGGVQFHAIPEAGAKPLVCDASSDFMCRPTDIERYALLYACAQKNAGPAGLTVVILRKDLLAQSSDRLPGYLNYRTQAENDSMFNTPPTFAIYCLGLVGKWLRDEIGGLAKMESINVQKAKTVYDAIDRSDGFYAGHAQPECRSLMNVTFNLPNDDLLTKFIAGAEERNLKSLAGHRSVGGIRASIYNAMPVTGAERLRDFMLEFMNLHA